MTSHNKNIIVPKKINDPKQIIIQLVFISNLTLASNGELMFPIQWKLKHQKTPLTWVKCVGLHDYVFSA